MSKIGNVLLKGKIWKKEVFDLIDFDNTNFTQTNISINDSGMVYRIENQVFYSKEINKIFKPFQLFEILKTDKEYFFISEKTKGNLRELPKENVSFLVYKGMAFKEYNSNSKKNWYQLNEGDIFRLGRIYIKVQKIRLEDLNSINKTYDGLSYCLSKNDSVGIILDSNHQVIKISKNKNFQKIKIFKRENSVQSLVLPRIYFD